MLRCRFGCKITQRIISQISESSRNLGFLRGFFLVILLISIWQKDSSNPFYYSEHQHVRKSVFFNRNKTWIILRFFRKMEIKIFVFLFTIFLFASTEATKREGHCKCHLGTKTKMMVNYYENRCKYGYTPSYHMIELPSTEFGDVTSFQCKCRCKNGIHTYGLDLYTRGYDPSKAQASRMG